MAASGGSFYLLDLVALPDAGLTRRLFRSDKEALKQQLIDAAKAADEKPTPAQIDKQIIAIERQEAALRAVETVQSAGGMAYYRSLNLLDGAAVSAVVEEIRQQYGRIDVLVHAGGIEISRNLKDKDAAQYNLVYDIKADGFFSLLRAAKGLPIGATVAFSSVAGRFGNGGQTDYSAANDLLCKITSSLRQWRPETRGIVIDWTAWGGIGMATRGSIPRIMRMAGIDMLPPESGIPTVRRELVAGGFRGEIVVGERLGVLLKEFDEQGGLDAEKASRWAAEKRLIMIGAVKAAKLYGGLEVETTLDPNAQPFLYDHQIEGTPVLPGVMGTEAFAELASTFAPGYRVAEIYDEEFASPFKFYRMEPQTLYLSATAQPGANGDLIAAVALRSRRVLADDQVQEKVHFTASVRLTRAEPEAQAVAFELPTDLPISSDAIYQIYFHGAAYKVLRGAVVSGDTAIGWLADDLPPNSDPADAALLIHPRLIELCFQTAGVWDIRTNGVMALPLSVGSLRVYGAPAAGQRLYARVTAVDGGFDAQVIDESGSVYVALTNYRTVRLPGSVSL
ncbi:MAG: SDR family NAD(P)-dependent oxidoreductase [Anaerolineae bacterium]